MARELGYGQPLDGLAQTAFTTPDLTAEIARWTRDLRAGPFFVLDHFLPWPKQPRPINNQ